MIEQWPEGTRPAARRSRGPAFPSSHSRKHGELGQARTIFAPIATTPMNEGAGVDVIEMLAVMVGLVVREASEVEGEGDGVRDAVGVSKAFWAEAKDRVMDQMIHDTEKRIAGGRQKCRAPRCHCWV